MKKQRNKLLRLFKFIYIKVFRINASPHKIAEGVGLGVFLGILPGAGIIAALFLASLLRMNRAAALIGVLITNTWLSIITFLASVKVGSYLMRLDWQEVYKSWALFLKNFHWSDLLKFSLFNIIMPIALGYFMVALGSALVVYLILVGVLTWRKNESKSRANLSRRS